MANTVKTPNMQLTLPVVGSDPGPDWANNLYNALVQVDQHNHSLGNGVQINVNGLNLTGDLTINSNNFTNARSIRFTPNSSPLALATDLGCLYESGVDLWYNDGSGNQVRLTSGGVVNATSSGIANGTASATFVSSVLVVNSNTSTPANIQVASVLLGNNVANSKYLTLQPPSAMAANYSVTLPSIPAQTSIMQLDTSGNMVANLVVDNSSLQNTSNTLSVKAQGITQAMLSPVTVATTVSAGGMAISNSSASFVQTTSTLTPVTNLSVTITTTGRPVQLRIIDDGVNSLIGSAGSGMILNGTGNCQAAVAFFIGSTQLTYQLYQVAIGSALASQVTIPASAVSHTDVSVNGAPGTYTYTVKVALGAGNALTMQNLKLLAKEV